MPINSGGKVYETVDEFFDSLDDDYNSRNKYRRLDIYYFFKRKWDRRHRLYRAPIHWYKRARYGYSEEDSWSLFYHVAGVIADGCRDLRERELGFPNGMTWEEWSHTLMEIENGMRLAQKDTGSLEDRMIIDSALEKFRDHFWDLWD